jgi:hypothetical protein
LEGELARWICRRGKGKASGGRAAGAGEEVEGRGRQWNSVWNPFIQSKHNFIHPFADERSKMIGLFGPKRASYISPLLNFFSFSFFYFFAIRK